MFQISIRKMSLRNTIVKSFLNFPGASELIHDKSIKRIINIYLQCSKLLPVRQPKADNWGGLGIVFETFLQFYVYDLRFNAAGLTTLLIEFWTLLPPYKVITNPSRVSPIKYVNQTYSCLYIHRAPMSASSPLNTMMPNCSQPYFPFFLGKYW